MEMSSLRLWAAAIPTTQGVVNALKQPMADVAILVPSVVAELAYVRFTLLLLLLDPFLAKNNCYRIQNCLTTVLPTSKRSFILAVIYPQTSGTVLLPAKVHLRCMLGATETGIVPQLLPPELLPSEASSRTLWRYVPFHPCVGAVFDKTTDGIYELVVRRENALADMHASPSQESSNSRNTVPKISLSRTLRSPIYGVDVLAQMTLSFFSMAKKKTSFPWNSTSWLVIQK